jgi:pimeloyl-ACP methyl ester carboxylesterase
MRRRIILLLLIAIILLVTIMITAQQYRTPQELADPNGAFELVNGASIYYVTEGNPADPAVIFVHGFGGSTFTWRDNLLPIAQAGFYAIALDLPPFGLSDKSADIGYARSDMAEYIVGLMDNLSIERAVIVGHSMGGGVAARMVISHPERISKLVFVAGGLFEAMQRDASTSESRQQSPFGFLTSIDPQAPGVVQLLRLTLRPQTFASIMSSAYFDPQSITDEMVAGYARPLQIEEWPEGFLAYLQVDEQSTLTLQDLATAATMPTLIMWGQEDTWVPLDLGQQMLEVLPDASIVTYPLTGHLPMEENTKQFNDDLITFLQS